MPSTRRASTVPPWTRCWAPWSIPCPCSGATSRPRRNGLARSVSPGGISGRPPAAAAAPTRTKPQGPSFSRISRPLLPNCETSPHGPSTSSWIDAEQRDGKQGGGFCMDLPLVKESRILCQLRRLPGSGLYHRPRAGPCLPQRLCLCRGEDRAAVHHPHDAGRNCLDPLRDHRHGRLHWPRHRTIRKHCSSSTPC